MTFLLKKQNFLFWLPFFCSKVSLKNTLLVNKNLIFNCVTVDDIVTVETLLLLSDMISFVAFAWIVIKYKVSIHTNTIISVVKNQSLKRCRKKLALYSIVSSWFCCSGVVTCNLFQFKLELSSSKLYFLVQNVCSFFGRYFCKGAGTVGPSSFVQPNWVDDSLGATNAIRSASETLD